MTTPTTLSTLTTTDLQHLHAYWRAANDLAVGQISLLAHPLVCEQPTLTHVKQRVLGRAGRP